VAIKEEAQVPARTDGLLIAVEAREGMQVHRGDILARQDERLWQAKKEVAEMDRQYAEKEASAEIETQFARAAERVAEVEYLNAVDANKQVEGTFPPSEVRRLKFQWQRAYLQIKQSEFQRALAAIKVDKHAGEVRAAQLQIDRLQIASPLDGEVVEVLKHQGEWAQAGEAVVRVVNFETLKVDGFLDVREHHPADVSGRTVTVQVNVAGRQFTFPGKIVHVSTLLEGGTDYRVSAEVTNRRERGQWLLRPGMTASMTLGSGS